jgi:hypothetical protein
MEFRNNQLKPDHISDVLTNLHSKASAGIKKNPAQHHNRAAINPPESNLSMTS